jgi:sugar O-acyltransferase (sialic acid O-acetyltransferase NeuD family)
MNRLPLILIGGGGHCRSCIDVIEMTNMYDIKAIVDLPEKIGESTLNYKINSTDEDIPNLVKKYKNALITIGQIKSPRLRIDYFNLLKTLGANLPVIVSPLSYISNHSEIGEGTIILHHVLINSNVKVGKNCIINTKSLLEHDVQIGDHCHISTGAIINGSTFVGDRSFIGSNAVAVESISIPSLSVFGAGEKISKRSVLK